MEHANVINVSDVSNFSLMFLAMSTDRSAEVGSGSALDWRLGANR